MNRMVIMMIGAAAFGAPVLAQAQAGGGFAQKDQTRAEVQQRAERMFQMIDTNHDGVVTRQEADQAAQMFAARGGGAGRMQRLIEQLFGSAQSITLQQFEALMLARFDAMDLNHDGIVTAAEREQYRARRRTELGVVQPSGPGTSPAPTSQDAPPRL